MALIGKIAIAMAVDTKKLGAGLKTAQGMVGSFQAKIEQSGGALKALLAGAAAYKAAEGIKSMVLTASDLNENMSKTQAIFGSGAKTVVAAADEMAAAFGTSKNEFLDAAGRMGGLFKGAGYSADEAAQLSVQFTKLAGDASSFFNLPFSDAFTKIRAGLSGESEPLKDLGILMNEDMVKAQAFAMGLGKAGQELSNQAKIQARAAIIARGLADAQGDLAKTADGVANRTRELSGRMTNLAATMGTSLQPIAQAVLGEMSTAVGALSIAWEENQSAIVAWATQAIGGVGETGKSMGMLQRAIGFIADSWNLMRLGFLAAQSYIVAGLAKLSEALAYTAENIRSLMSGDWITTLAPGLTMLFDLVDDRIKKSIENSSVYFKAIGEDLKKLGGQEWEGFEKKLAQKWPSESINEYFDKASKRTKALRDEMARVPRAAVEPAPDAAKVGKTHFASQMTAGSREAANAVLRSRYGASVESKGPEAQTAKNTAKTNDLLSQILSSAVGIPNLKAGGLFGNF